MEELIKKIDGYIKEFDLNKKCRKQIYMSIDECISATFYEEMDLHLEVLERC